MKKLWTVFLSLILVMTMVVCSACSTDQLQSGSGQDDTHTSGNDGQDDTQTGGGNEQGIKVGALHEVYVVNEFCIFLPLRPVPQHRFYR